MSARLRELTDAFIDCTRGDRLLAQSEGFVKVRCMEAALDLGWTLQEGSNQTRGQRLADFAKMGSGGIEWSRGQRLVTLMHGSTDFAIVEPVVMQLEIKTRPDWGTKAQAQFQQMDADVERVANDPGIGFLFVFDLKVYLSFVGEKTERRGRRASPAAQWFIDNFARMSALTRASVGGVAASATRSGHQLELDSRLSESNVTAGSVVVTGCRRDATF